MKKSLCVLSMLLLAGCAGQSATDRNWAKEMDAQFNAYKATLPEPGADYGKYPNNYQALIKEFMNSVLKDPGSAQYSNFSKPRKEHAIADRRAIYGYSACVMVNAKNSFGGYTGAKQYWFFIHNGNVVRYQTVSGKKTIIYVGHYVNCQDG